MRRNRGPRVGGRTIKVSRRHQSPSSGLRGKLTSEPADRTPVYQEEWTSGGIEWRREYDELPDHVLHPNDWKLDKRTYEWHRKSNADGADYQIREFLLVMIAVAAIILVSRVLS
jgi:hypothetical protein